MTVVLPWGSRVIDITRPPYGADNTGVLDAADAFRRALNELPLSDSGVIPTLFIPAGTYRLSDTVKLWTRRAGSVRVMGAGEASTVLKLDDRCRLFEAGEDRPLLSLTGEALSAVLEGFTLDTGTGNPGAVGLRFDARGRASHLCVRSGDGDGTAAVESASALPVSFRRLSTRGFAVGLELRGCASLAQVRVEETQCLGIRVAGGIAALREVSVSGFGDGLFCGENGMLLAEDTQVLHLGQRGGCGIVSRGGSAALRRYSVCGFGASVVNGGDTVLPGDGAWDEYTSCDRVWRLFPNKRNVLGLRAEPRPEFVFDGGPGQIARVCDFGAVGDGLRDDSEAIAAAMASGRPVVAFDAAHYLCGQPMAVPASVKAVLLGGSVFSVTAEAAAREGSLFTVAEVSEAPLFLEGWARTLGPWGKMAFLGRSARRDTVLSDVEASSGAVYAGGAGGRIFLENVSSAKSESVPAFTFREEQAEVCGLTAARDGLMILAGPGAKLRLSGFVTSGKGTALRAELGAEVELLAGTAADGTDDGTACLECEEASMYAFLRTDGMGARQQYRAAVRAVQNTCERKLRPESLPRYGTDFYSIPGFMTAVDTPPK